MMKRNLIILLLLPALFLLAGCENPIDGQGPEAGGPTTFTATIEGGDGTKTTLGDPDAEGVRAVNWSSNDSISISGAIYKESSGAGTATATFTGSGAQLDGGKYKAYYPASVYNGGTPSLPAEQSYDKDRIDNLPMYAEDATTTLNFKNLCAVLEIKLTGDGTQTLGSIGLKSTEGKKLSGAFTPKDWDSDSRRIEMAASASDSVTLSCGTGVQLSSTEKSFFIAVPAQDYGSGTFKITLKTPSGDVIGSYTATAAMLLARSKIYDATLPFFKLGDLSPVTLSYRGGTSTLAPSFMSYKTAGGATTAVPYTFQYKAYDSDTDEYASDWTDGLPDWLTGSSASNQQGSVTGEEITLTMPSMDYHRDILAARPGKTNFDLSTYNVATGATIARTTANCYVVDAPGTYKFPVVYGNALRNGVENEYAYHATTDGSTFRTEEKRVYPIYYTNDASNPRRNQPTWDYFCFLNYFKNYKNEDITSPYIETDLGASLTAKLIWTDVQDLVKNVGITGSGPDRYVTFEVGRDSIRQGNALIAVLDGATIAWSWHIWVTDEDLTQTKEGDIGYHFSLVNLGWCDGYPERKCKLRIVQGGGSSLASDEMIVTQEGLAANNTYYQWGRKDPLCANAVASTREGPFAPQPDDEVAASYRKTYYPSEASYSFQIAPQGQVPTLGEVIQTPYILYRGTLYDYSTERGLLYSSHYANLWNSGLDGDDDLRSAPNPHYSDPVVKTIYDPSPVGYKMPTVAAWRDFAKSDFTIVGTPGKAGYGRKRANGLFFPAMGQHTSAPNSYYLESVGYDVQYLQSLPHYTVYVDLGKISDGRVRESSYGLSFYTRSSTVSGTISVTTSNGNPIRPVTEASGPTTGGTDPYTPGGSSGF